MLPPPGPGFLGERVSRHVSVGRVTRPSCGRQLWGGPAVWSMSHHRRILLPRVYSTTASALWLEFWGRAAWQAAPSSAVCQYACHQLLPWLRATFATVPDAVLPGSDQWPWSTAPATGSVGRLGRYSASDPWGVPLLPSVHVRVRPTWRLFTGVRAVCGMRVLLVVASLPLFPPALIFFSFLFLFVLYLFYFFLLFFGFF